MESELSELGRREASRNFLGFVNRLSVEPPPAKHHCFIIDKLEAVERGEIKNLMLFLPPGSAKSTYASVLFPAYFFGRNPKKGLIAASYGGDLAEHFGRKVRDLVGSEEYRDVFDIGINPSMRAVRSWQTDKGGHYYAVGAGMGVTGHRGDGGLIDDPVKGREEADSEKIQDKTWEWYLSDFTTRLKPDAFQIIIQTRWHEKDISGRILPENYNGESGLIKCRDGQVWDVVCLPAICERADDPLGRKIGERLWPEWFGSEFFPQKRSFLGERNWSALYQQRPSPETGDYFKREWLRYYTEPPAQLKKYGASDYAVTADGGDFTEHGVVGVDPNDDIYILDWWYGQTASDVWIEQLISLILKHRPAEWAEESGQINKSLGPFIDKRQREERAYCYRKQFPSCVDKATRAQAFRGRLAQGKVYLPSPESPNHGAWVERLIMQMMVFPVGTYDDGIDVLSLFGRMLGEMTRGREPEKQEKPRYSSELTFSELRDHNARMKRQKEDAD